MPALHTYMRIRTTTADVPTDVIFRTEDGHGHGHGLFILATYHEG
jgi:hypothetical protein